jgi:hypothetical protein
MQPLPERRTQDQPLPIAQPDDTHAETLAAAQAHREESRAAVTSLAGALGLPKAAADAVAEHAGDVAALDGARLQPLVDSGQLSAADARALRLAAGIHQLTGEPTLAEVVRVAPLPGIGRPAQSLRELTTLDTAGWNQAILTAGVTPPDGLSTMDLANAMRDRVDRVFPGAALLQRLTPSVDGLAADLASATVQDGAARTRLTALANAYPGLQLDQVVSDGRTDARTRAGQIADRIAAVGRIAAALGDADPLRLDLSAGSADLVRLGPVEPGVLTTLKAHQRAYQAGGDVQTAQLLLQAGLHGAYAIAQQTADYVASSTGLTAQQADAVYTRAVRMASMLTGTFGGAMEVGTGNKDQIKSVAPAPDVNDYLRRLDGFADLFGSQAACDCGHCESILGPGAYFADLMFFVEHHVSRVFVGARAAHPMALRSRRPDLWTTKLTCENTNTLIPSLTIINEILENYIATSRGYPASQVDNRQAVEKAVYEQALAISHDSVRLPFSLPLARLSGYLGVSQTTRAQVAEAIGISGAGLTCARLDLSTVEYDLIRNPNTNLAFLQEVFGMAQLDHAGLLQPFDAQEMVRAIEVTRGQLGDLFGTRFVAAGGTPPVITPEKIDQTESVQNDIERVHGLTTTGLDRIDRFIRLWHRLDWTVAELDLVLTAIGATNLSPVTELDSLGQMREAQRRVDLPIAEVCALAGALPTVPAASGEPTPFDRLFNPEPFASQDGRYPAPTTTFLHPALRPANTPAASDPNQHRLQAALGVTEAELLTLIRMLRGPLGIDPDATDPAARAFTLTLGHLSTLYQHARLARALQLSIVDFGRLLGPVAAPAHPVADPPLADPAVLLDRLDRVDRWRESGRSLDDLDVLGRRAPLDPGRYPDPATVVAGILAELAAEGILTFADTVFAFLDGVTEDASRAVIAANATRIVPAGSGRFRLADTFDLAAPLTMPAGVSLDPVAVRELLANHHPSRVLPSKLAGRLRVPVSSVTVLLGMLGTDLTTGPVPAAVQQGQAAPLLAVVADLVPLVTLLPANAFTGADVVVVAASPAVVGLAQPRQIGEDAIRAVAVITRTLSDNVTARDTMGVLAAYSATSGFAAADPTLLARVLDVPAGLVPGLVRSLSIAPSDTAASALSRLLACAGLAQLLGVGGETLALAVSQSYVDESAAADALLAAVRTRHPDDLDGVDDALRSRRRDALADFLIHSAFPQFTSREDLYQYFLIDVELQGCVRTSRVVAATSSVQLYVYRCLMNLEQDRRAASDPAAVRVPPSLVPADEWKWRKNYRVWEANRKVYLWPENYLEPALRDDKSPLFRELEADLLQKPIDEQSVLDAFSNYLTGFEELARLRIAGSYHEYEMRAHTDVLHLFGVSEADPPTFYYRAVRNAHYGVTEADKGTVWEPWRRIDVQIASRNVSPIVLYGRLYVFWVEWTTKPKNTFVNGSSNFTAYQHTMTLNFTSLRLDGAWSAPQKVRLREAFPFVGDGVLEEYIGGDKMAQLDWERRRHDEPREGYRPGGFLYDVAYPEFDSLDGQFRVTGAGMKLSAFVDLATRTGTSYHRIPFRPARSGRHLYASPGTDSRALNQAPNATFIEPCYSAGSFYLDGQRLEEIKSVIAGAGVMEQQSLAPFLTLPPGTELALVNGSLDDCFLDVQGDLMLVQGSVRPAPGFLIRRLGTRLAPDMIGTLFRKGVDGLLRLDNQLWLREPAMPVTDPVDVAGDLHAGTLDFTGAYGCYYREIFLHIPYLIANHLNSQQRFDAAQRWYHYLFDPTANETIVTAGLTPAQAAHRELDRNWRYLEFRGKDVPTLRSILTDAQAIEAYEAEPLNPHAIARLRMSAYQKNIVFKYVDNLLDWADSLFAQFTTESVNEATLLYHMASQILGERPPLLGECGVGVTDRTYDHIGPALEKGSEFLAELETVLIGQNGKVSSQQFAAPTTNAQIAPAALDFWNTPIVAQSAQAMTSVPASNAFNWSQASVSHWERTGDKESPQQDQSLSASASAMASFGFSLVRQISPVFCVPVNPELDRRWQRVADQLYKIRNCLDITGARRQLALFAPEIDPRLLIRAAAAGLSLDDVLNATAGNLPPYRFAYLIERAKSHAALVQSFGSALLAALEKKDTEELNRLRNTQQQNLLKLATQARRWDIAIAEDAIEVLQRQQAAAEYRRQYYQGLADQNLIPSEQQQSDSRNLASGLQEAGGILDLAGGIAHLVPQIGAFTAMKFGGMEIGNALKSFGQVLHTAASIAEANSAAAGLRASFERRLDGWQHQVKLIDHELGQLTKQIAAAQIHRDIAQRSLDLHETTIAQVEEVATFYADRFTGLGLYTWLSQSLQRAYREAYNSAYAMARLAEQAYRFERGDDTSILLDPSYWDSSHAGLLAGERLVVDLHAMERRFVETNYRTLEVDQALSLTMLDPAALITLRETGSCDFNIDEFHFDLLYPGHYRRKVKSVRLTIPCVTGPYTNVAATLTLLGSSVRTSPAAATTAVVGVPLRRSVSIATSTAQQDAGVFEFSFRDERYMPFEGAGAVSQWRLSLPRTLTAFDYRSITDVILHVTYTAEADELYRGTVEGAVTQSGSLLQRLSTAPTTRVLSLRHDFSSTYQRLLASPVDTKVPVRVAGEHFPLYLDRRQLTASKVRLVLVPRRGQALGSFELWVDGVAPANPFAVVAALGGLPATDITNLWSTAVLSGHTLSVHEPGSLGLANPIPGDLAAVDSNLLEDILIVMEFTAS